jgi:hypothetical protein
MRRNKENPRWGRERRQAKGFGDAYASFNYYIITVITYMDMPKSHALSLHLFSIAMETGPTLVARGEKRNIMDSVELL